MVSGVFPCFVFRLPGFLEDFGLRALGCLGV